MMYRLIQRLDRCFGLPSAAAHCDIPCGIYDPATAQLAALSVIRFVDLLLEIDPANASLQDQAKLARLVREKETHAEKVKHEIRVIWGDAMKAEQREQNPELDNLAHQVMQLGSACRQHVDRGKAEQLLEAVNNFAEAFWAIKGVETYTANCPYAPAMPVVYPKLG